MMTKEKITALLKEKQDYLSAEFGVRKIGLFGSYEKGTAHEGSDIDLVIEFSRPIGFHFFSLEKYLEEVLGTPVDILTSAGIKGIRVPRVAKEIQETVAYV